MFRSRMARAIRNGVLTLVRACNKGGGWVRHATEGLSLFCTDRPIQYRLPPTDGQEDKSPQHTQHQDSAPTHEEGSVQKTSENNAKQAVPGSRARGGGFEASDKVGNESAPRVREADGGG